MLAQVLRQEDPSAPKPTAYPDAPIALELKDAPALQLYLCYRLGRHLCIDFRYIYGTLPVHYVVFPTGYAVPQSSTYVRYTRVYIHANDNTGLSKCSVYILQRLYIYEGVRIRVFQCSSGRGLRVLARLPHRHPYPIQLPITQALGEPSQQAQQL